MITWQTYKLYAVLCDHVLREWYQYKLNFVVLNMHLMLWQKCLGFMHQFIISICLNISMTRVSIQKLPMCKQANSKFHELSQWGLWIPFQYICHLVIMRIPITWWCHQMETFSALLAICAGSGEFPAQRPMTRSFDIFFDLRPKKRSNKQWWGWWFETPLCSLWRHRNEIGKTVLPPSYRHNWNLHIWKDYICIEMGPWVPIQYRIRRLIMRSHKASKARDWVWNVRIALQFAWRLCSNAAETPAKFQSNWKTLSTDLASSRLCEILFQSRVIIGL